MQIISINIEDADYTDVVNAHSEDYMAEVIDEDGNTVPNSVTREQHAKENIIKSVVRKTVDYKKSQALANTNIDELVIT